MSQQTSEPQPYPPHRSESTLQSSVASPMTWLEEALSIANDFKGADFASPVFWSLVLTQAAGLVVAVLAFFGVSVPASGTWIQLGETLGGLVAASIASVFLHRHVSVRRAQHFSLAQQILDLHPATHASPPIVK